MDKIRTVIEVKEDYGEIQFFFKEIMERKNLNRNQVAERAQVSHDLITKWCNGNIERMDIDVLTRICYVLDCQISDVMRYTKDEEVNKEIKEEDHYLFLLDKIFNYFDK